MNEILDSLKHMQTQLNLLHSLDTRLRSLESRHTLLPTPQPPIATEAPRQEVKRGRLLPTPPLVPEPIHWEPYRKPPLQYPPSMPDFTKSREESYNTNFPPPFTYSEALQYRARQGNTLNPTHPYRERYQGGRLENNNSRAGFTTRTQGISNSYTGTQDNLSRGAITLSKGVQIRHHLSNWERGTPLNLKDKIDDLLESVNPPMQNSELRDKLEKLKWEFSNKINSVVKEHLGQQKEKNIEDLRNLKPERENEILGRAKQMCQERMGKKWDRLRMEKWLKSDFLEIGKSLQERDQLTTTLTTTRTEVTLGQNRTNTDTSRTINQTASRSNNQTASVPNNPTRSVASNADLGRGLGKRGTNRQMVITPSPVPTSNRFRLLMDEATSTATPEVVVEVKSHQRNVRTYQERTIITEEEMEVPDNLGEQQMELRSDRSRFEIQEEIIASAQENMRLQETDSIGEKRDRQVEENGEAEDPGIQVIGMEERKGYEDLEPDEEGEDNVVLGKGVSENPNTKPKRGESSGYNRNYEIFGASNKGRKREGTDTKIRNSDKHIEIKSSKESEKQDEGMTRSQPSREMERNDDTLGECSNTQPDLTFFPTQTLSNSKPVVVVHETSNKSTWMIGGLKTNSKVLVLADSQFRRLRGLPNSWEVHVFPGAYLQHAVDILSRLTDTKNLTTIIIHVGINNRTWGHKNTVIDVNKLIQQLKKRDLDTYIMGVSVPQGFLEIESNNLKQMNEKFREKMGDDHFIDPLLSTEVGVESDGLHYDQPTLDKISLALLKRFLVKWISSPIVRK